MANAPTALSEFDFILLNTSAGKDSQAMIDQVMARAKREGFPLDRILAVHCDLGRVEWQGTADLAQRQCDAYGIELRIVSRPQGDLLDQIQDRGMFPSNTARYCTSDHKRGQVYKVMTAVAAELKDQVGDRRVRILNCMGIRAAESTARSKKNDYYLDAKASNKTRREVWTWFPIFDLGEAEVWKIIGDSGVEHHRAYDLGMPRLSCVFCVFAPKPALMLAGKHNPELLAQYVEVEREIGHTLTAKLSLVEIAEALERGDEIGNISTWEMPV